MNPIQFCQQMSDEAYEQELNRERIIGVKTEYLFKWLTLLTAIFNIAVPIIATETSVDFEGSVFVILYALMMVFLLGAMVMVAAINFPRKVKRNPSGSEWMKRIQNHPEKYETENDFIYQNILCKDVIIEKMKKNNNRSVIFITIANCLLIAALVCMSIFLGYVIWG